MTAAVHRHDSAQSGVEAGNAVSFARCGAPTCGFSYAATASSRRMIRPPLKGESKCALPPIDGGMQSMSKLDKLVDLARPHLEPGEAIGAAVLGTYETKIMGGDTVRAGIL